MSLAITTRHAFSLSALAVALALSALPASAQNLQRGPGSAPAQAQPVEVAPGQPATVRQVVTEAAPPAGAQEITATEMPADGMPETIAPPADAQPAAAAHDKKKVVKVAPTTAPVLVPSHGHRPVIIYRTHPSHTYYAPRPSYGHSVHGHGFHGQYYVVQKPHHGHVVHSHGHRVYGHQGFVTYRGH